MRRPLITQILLLVALAAVAQPTTLTTRMQTFSNNAPSDRQPRSWQYYPEGEAFVCVNGNNRFTRALYGSIHDYRIETSDRPLFALYAKKNYRNMRLMVDGVPLDSTEWCKAEYVDGSRLYTLRDSRWGADATLRVRCIAMSSCEGVYWKVERQGFANEASRLTVVLCDIAAKRLSRNGDIGADKPGVFEASPQPTHREQYDTIFSRGIYIQSTPLPLPDGGHTVRLADISDEVMNADYMVHMDYNSGLASRLRFSTPNPYLNTLGQALSFAADGVWDGETWLHGAIGWRMPLAGWRAGYLGDVMGWNDRAISHFNAYARSQVNNVPPTIPSPSQDTALNLARAVKQWGTQMYSNGYICRNPGRNDQMSHYDMNLNYIDELLWHFEYDADTAYMRRMWPVLTSHLAWERRNFDPYGRHLYDAYCCIWASDALYYNGGEVTHSSAYNYRGNLLAARMARLLGEDPTPWQREAEAIRHAMNKRLWVTPQPSAATDGYIGHWGEYRDTMGLRRLHENAGLWSIYTPIDCGVGTPEQDFSCTQYVKQCIPHIPVMVKEDSTMVGQLVATSNWMPYSWSINNVASAEIMHTALALFRAGNATDGYELLQSNILDQMYLGVSPANFGQVSYYDAARGESYRDFGDNVGISARAIIQGLFGIVPQALDGQCIIRPGFPLAWDSVSVATPYLSYRYERRGDSATIALTQRFSQPLRMVVRINGECGAYTDYYGNGDSCQVITFPITAVAQKGSSDMVASSMPGAVAACTPSFVNPFVPSLKSSQYPVPMDKSFNANVTDIFRNKYLSPRPATTSLELPSQGIGEWCHPLYTAEINDSGFRAAIVDDRYRAGDMVFASPRHGHNIAFASLWDNYPDSIVVDVRKAQRATAACLLIAGSTNHMQAYIDNAHIVAYYTDGSSDTLALCPPYNYAPIEQDYYTDGLAFPSFGQRLTRIALRDNIVSDDLGSALGIPQHEVYGRLIPGGAAQILFMPLDSQKKVRRFTLRCLSNDVVVGLMGITLLK